MGRRPGHPPHGAGSLAFLAGITRDVLRIKDSLLSERTVVLRPGSGEDGPAGVDTAPLASGVTSASGGEYGGIFALTLRLRNESVSGRPGSGARGPCDWRERRVRVGRPGRTWDAAAHDISARGAEPAGNRFRGSRNGAYPVDRAARCHGRTGQHLVAGQRGVDRRAGAIDAPQDAERPEQAILVGGGSRQP